MEEKTESKSRKWIWILILILIIILVPAGIWVFKNNEIKNLTEDFGQERLEMERQFESKFREEQKEHARLMVKPLTWAVRAEMMRDNLEQVNQYLSQFVKEKNIQQVMLVDNDGQILISTDKKTENAAFSEWYDAALLQDGEITLSEREGGDVAIVAPVMGLDTRLGTLVVFYKPSQYESSYEHSAEPEIPAE
ncbi:MAG: PDC sensor domain-containing protein [Bacteroidia bacterium]